MTEFYSPRIRDTYLLRVSVFSAMLFVILCGRILDFALLLEELSKNTKSPDVIAIFKELQMPFKWDLCK